MDMMIDNAHRRIAEARCLLVSEIPAYGFAALKVNFNVNLEKTATACISINTEKSGFELTINPSFISSMSAAELAFVIAHELEHLIRCHLVRDISDVEYPDLMNIAADMTIHGHASNPKIGLKSPQGQPIIPRVKGMVWVPKEWQDNLTMEQYYRKLVSQYKTNKLASWLIVGKVLDDHSTWRNANGWDEELIQDFIISAIDMTEPGNLPGHWLCQISSVQKGKVSWQKVLRNYISVAFSRYSKSSTQRRSRRHRWFGAPGHKRRESRRVVIVVDTSGSVSQGMMEQFFGEIDSLTNYAKMDLLLWDHDFQGFWRDYKPGEWKSRIKIGGRGGTDMCAPIKWIQNQHLKAECYLILTDGICDWPEKIRTPIIGVIVGSRNRGSNSNNCPSHIRRVEILGN